MGLLLLVVAALVAVVLMVAADSEARKNDAPGRGTRPPTTAPTEACVTVGSGPVKPGARCATPWTYAKGGRVVMVDACASVGVVRPFAWNRAMYTRNGTGFWCPVGLPLYAPRNKKTRLQWGWCSCGA